MTATARGGRAGASTCLASLLPADVRWPDVAATDADTVELKLLIEPGPDTVGRVCGPAARRRRRRLYLLDTADLALSRSGIDLRLRRRARGRHEISVRSRRGWLRGRARPPNSRVELDLLPGTVLHTTELRRSLAPDIAARCLSGALAPARLLTPTQLEWLARWFGSVPPSALLDAITIHGPVAVQRVRVPPGRFPLARAFVEHAVYPSGRELTEFSVRCDPRDAAVVALAADGYLAERGVVPARRHHTKSACWAAETGVVAQVPQ